MYTLYYSPGVCSMSVHVVLEELGVEFDTYKVDLSKGEHQQPEYLAIHPPSANLWPQNKSLP